MHSTSYKPGQSFVFRLPPGEDLLVGLYRMCREYNVKFGTFQVMGSVRNATIGHLEAETGSLRSQVLEHGQDLVTCSGNVSPQGDTFSIHAYAVVSNAQGQVAAGKLLAGEVYVAEVFLHELKGRPQVRERDPETGLWLWPVA
ncbi:MAG: DUF296 domain-containing protein [Anaerolineae bacterium]|nr:DUF296 domain-containing protein [Anaerolineae bacterium]